jgi:LAO/AO transport system kinase
MTQSASQLERILQRDVRSVARAITNLENETPTSIELLKKLFPHTGKGLTIGITGAPGAGKSSLVDKLALQFRAMEKSVGIVAIDPSSPFSGGALLGDRIRMQALSTDPNVFIRSMATRGNLGGLSRATVDAVAVLDAAGYDRTLVETVGVGQDEIDIVKTADVCVVVLVPGMGDSIQAIKAGIMEIGDIFVINKAERDGVEQTERELLGMLEMTMREDGWHPPIVRTVATENRGLDKLAEAIENYRLHLLAHVTDNSKRTAIAEHRLLEILREQLLRRALKSLDQSQLKSYAEEIASKKNDPYSIAEQIMNSSSETMSDSSSNLPRKINHLGIAVNSIDEALAFWRDGMGLELHDIEVVADQGVRVAMLPLGESRIELLEATGDETPLAKFIAKRGAGIHHVAVDVENINDKLAELKERGIRLIDEQPRIGAGGSLIAFIHPASTGGVLVELVQHN